LNWLEMACWHEMLVGRAQGCPWAQSAQRPHWLLRRYHNGIEAWLAVTQAAVNTAISCQLIYFTYTVPAELYDQHLVPTPWFMKPLSKVGEAAARRQLLARRPAGRGEGCTSKRLLRPASQGAAAEGPGGCEACWAATCRAPAPSSRALPAGALQGMPDMLPFWVLVGCLTWAAGEALSLYHHQLLSTLRADRSAAYAPPAGGLFALVWCPHYLFELVAWAGIVILTQHPQPLVVWLAMCSFLGGRAIATRAWYQRRMGAAFPAGRRCIVPFLL